MSINAIVHCHVCPMKDLCKFQASDDTYKFVHSSGDWSLGRLEIARANCPLRKVLVWLMVQSSDAVTGDVQQSARM